MKINEILKFGGLFGMKDMPPHPDDEHSKVHRKTGFWGKAGAGSIFLAKNTQRIGIAHRGRSVQQPGTWGTVGGAIDPGEQPRDAAIAEAGEEVGYYPQRGDYLVELDVFETQAGDLLERSTFTYTTFIYVVEQEFKPVLDWENQDFRFFEFGQWPQPLHFGLAGTLKKPECLAKIQAEIAKYANRSVATAPPRTGNPAPGSAQ